MTLKFIRVLAAFTLLWLCSAALFAYTIVSLPNQRILSKAMPRPSIMWLKSSKKNIQPIPVILSQEQTSLLTGSQMLSLAGNKILAYRPEAKKLYLLKLLINKKYAELKAGKFTAINMPGNAEIHQVLDHGYGQALITSAKGLAFLLHNHQISLQADTPVASNYRRVVVPGASSGDLIRQAIISSGGQTYAISNKGQLYMQNSNGEFQGCKLGTDSIIASMASYNNSLYIGGIFNGYIGVVALSTTDLDSTCSNGITINIKSTDKVSDLSGYQLMYAAQGTLYATGGSGPIKYLNTAISSAWQSIPNTTPVSYGNTTAIIRSGQDLLLGTFNKGLKYTDHSGGLNLVNVTTTGFPGVASANPVLSVAASSGSVYVGTLSTGLIVGTGSNNPGAITNWSQPSAFTSSVINSLVTTSDNKSLLVGTKSGKIYSIKTADPQATPKLVLSPSSGGEILSMASDSSNLFAGTQTNGLLAVTPLIYQVDSSGSVSLCNLDSNGQTFNCSDIPGYTAAGGVLNIEFSPSGDVAYIVDGLGKSIETCSVDLNGAFSNCATASASFNYINNFSLSPLGNIGYALDGMNVGVYTITGGSIASAPSSSTTLPTYSSDMAMVKTTSGATYAYFVQGSQYGIRKYQINPSDGALMTSGTLLTSSGWKSPSWVVTGSASQKAYIVNTTRNGKEIVVCDITSDGDFKQISSGDVSFPGINNIVLDAKNKILFIHSSSTSGGVKTRECPLTASGSFDKSACKVLTSGGQAITKNAFVLPVAF